MHSDSARFSVVSMASITGQLDLEDNEETALLSDERRKAIDDYIEHIPTSLIPGEEKFKRKHYCIELRTICP